MQHYRKRFHELTTDQLYLKQKALLDQFLEKGAISQAQHDNIWRDEGSILTENRILNVS